MKKLLMLSIGLISTSYILAQDITDAVRYSMDEIQGTARFRAMSGAFGALGGDLSSVNINPAGSAIFNNSQAALSLGVFNTSKDISYFNGNTTASNTSVDLNQLGAAFVFKNTNSNSKWKKFSLSIAYDRSSDFDDEWIASGTNPDNTIANYFLLNAQGLRLDEISRFSDESLSEAYSAIGSSFGFRHQQAFLGYESFIINPVDDTDENTAYTSSIDLNGGDFRQRYAYTSNGYNGKLAFNFSTSYDDKFFFGMNLNSHFIDYDRQTVLEESNSHVNSVVTKVNFGNDLRTTGSGFSLQLGGIAKITEELRVGLSYNSPTWFRISDETTQYVRTSGLNLNQNINPNVINVYEEYKLQSPSKITGSLAYVFGKMGLISFDYSVKDYSNIKFKPTSDPFFSELNNNINSSLTSAVTYKFGGEYRYKQLSFRGGYRFEGSPYKDNDTVGDLDGYSAGLGYSFGDFNLDLAYSYAERDVNYQLYNVGLTDSAIIKSKYSDFILTLGFRL